MDFSQSPRKKAMNNTTPPTSKEDLQRFLAMLTYLAKFIPNLSQIAAPLRALLENDTEWQSHPEHLLSFLMLKHLASPRLLQSKPTSQTLS